MLFKVTSSIHSGKMNNSLLYKGIMEVYQDLGTRWFNYEQLSKVGMFSASSFIL